MSILHSCIMTLCLSMLESDEFYIRQFADTYLQKAEEKAHSYIIIGTKSKDLEVRRRCERLLKLLVPVGLGGKSWVLLPDTVGDKSKYYIKFNNDGSGILIDTVRGPKVQYPFKWTWESNTLIINPTSINSVINPDEKYYDWEYVSNNRYKCKLYHHSYTLTLVEPS